MKYHTDHAGCSMERELCQNKTTGRMTRRLGLFDMKNNDELRVELGMERERGRDEIGKYTKMERAELDG